AFSTDALFFHIEMEKEWFDSHDIRAGLLEGSIQLKDPALQSVFQKIYGESKINDDITQLSVDGLLLQSFATILRDSRRERHGVPGWVKKVREMLNDGETEGLTLRKISDETGIHVVHLSKEFPKYFHSGFGEYIRKRKVEKATRLLLN